MSELIGESELVFLAWRRVPFPDFFGRFDSVPFSDFLGRFASWQVAFASKALAALTSSGSLSCSVAADAVKAELADNIVLLVE